MTDRETEQVLSLLYAEVGRPVPRVKIKTWAAILQPVPFELGLMAAKEMIRTTRIFGEPQFSDYREHVNRLHREAKRALKPQRTRDASLLVHMDPAEREAYLAQQRANTRLTHTQAKRILQAIRARAIAAPQRCPEMITAQQERE